MNRSELPTIACPVCATPLPNTASFCAQCSTQLSRCPICSQLVSTGPTTCIACGTQLSLPKRKPHESESSMSMIFPDATVFFERKKKAQDDSSLFHQELSYQVPTENHTPLVVPVPKSQTLPATALPGEEMLFTSSASTPPSAVPPEVEHAQVREEVKRSDRVGQQLGNYQLIRFLGEGGFADVYLGEHIHLGSQAAIKVLHSQLTSEDIDAFRTEARTLVRLIHPHIVRVLDFGIEGRTPFLIMDYAPNGTLRQLHPKGRPLSLVTVISYVKQVAEALQFAHDEKIIHRDIKPENMLLGRRNEVLLSDFGIALVVQSSRYQSTRDMAGTISYMVPEQIQVHPRPASDQYSLGIVVYEWLCGQRPFRGSFREIAIKHAVVPPPSLCEQIPTLPAAVEEVVLKALAKDPKDRFESVWAFAVALEQSSLGSR